ncbi:P-loop containing nucleoside triphosphate hydrolase protein [Wallemia mellicola]|nr:P-loop containing nucleoside triphosphate hydrolase protein [Wallemia mellicola]TIC56599.1 P-loop containing nucleoside triphosphate hydrolase protein [Wallemia mellicola]
MKVILIGVGGSSSSGKTTLSKKLLNILPNSFIIHQDDFAPPNDKIPLDPIHNVQNWDDPDYSIEWDRLIKVLDYVKTEGKLPSSHKSHDHLHPPSQSNLISKDLNAKELVLQKKSKERSPDGVIYALLDGFLCFYNETVRNMLDVRIFLNADRETLKKRRAQREGYATAEGDVWIDPPFYFDDIVWPAYIKAHKDVFVNGDPEAGIPTPHIRDLHVYDSTKLDVDEILSNATVDIVEYARQTRL